jgi:hypothetical protein
MGCGTPPFAAAGLWPDTGNAADLARAGAHGATKAGCHDSLLWRGMGIRSAPVQSHTLALLRSGMRATTQQGRRGGEGRVGLAPQPMSRLGLPSRQAGRLSWPSGWRGSSRSSLPPCNRRSFLLPELPLYYPCSCGRSGSRGRSGPSLGVVDGKVAEDWRGGSRAVSMWCMCACVHAPS